MKSYLGHPINIFCISNIKLEFPVEMSIKKDITKQKNTRDTHIVKP